jgi:ferric-dicitrate binding protein FerR (iron transport regulator)
MNTDDFLPDDSELSPERSAALRDAIEKDPELRTRLKAWAEMRSDVRRDLRYWLENRKALVDAALGDADDEVTLRLDADSERHPGLADVVRSIRHAASDFSSVWDEHVSHEKTVAGGQRPPLRSVPSPLRWIWRSAVAASVVIFIGLAITLSGREANMITVATQQGETILVELAGGSTVQVLESSVFMYPDPVRVPVTRGNTRLEGAAYFQVVPGGAGLVVETPEAVTTVLGTEFGVRSVDGVSEIMVTRGVVSVSSSSTGSEVHVRASEMTVVERGGDPTPPAMLGQADVIIWQNILVFRSASVESVKRVLEDRYDVIIDVDAAFTGETLTGTFQISAGVDDVLDTIASALGGGVRKLTSNRFLIQAD